MTQNIKTELTREDLRQAQKIMLYIMKRIHAVCVEHNIKYWLDYGTLLGAIRHDGFIPWDDDMDICMMREDYEKFCKIAPEALGEEFFLQTKSTEPDFCFEFGKVRLKNTIWMEREWINTPLNYKGIFVDIFPIESFPESKLQTSFLTYSAIFYNILLARKAHNIHSKKIIKEIVLRILSAFTTRKILLGWFEKTVKNLKKLKNTSSKVSKLFGTSMTNWTDKATLEEVVLKKFEDSEFFIPKNYDARLTEIFGNYMQLPPENKQYGHHNVEYFDFGKYKF